MATGGLTDDQAAVYDRQLRVWGIEVQKKLTAARVLIAGFGQLAAEVAKNIVLAGVGNVALLDDTPAEQHAGRNFLITSAADPGSSAAEAAAKTLQAMNPLVRVSAAPGSAASLLASTSDEQAVVLGGYDLVIACGLPLASVRALDAACRDASSAPSAAAAEGAEGSGGQRVMFMAGEVRGPNAYLFLDLQQHSYVPKASGDAGQQQKQSGMQQQQQQPQGEQHLDYPSFSDALATPLAALPSTEHPVYPLLQAVASFEQANSRAPTSSDSDAVRALFQAATSAPGDAAGPSTPPQHPCAAAALRLLPTFVGASEFAPVAAIAGGVAANNVVRAVSGSDAPLKNFFFYSLLDGRGFVEERPLPGAAASNGGSTAKAAQHEVIEL